MARKERKEFMRNKDGSIIYTSDGNFIYAETEGGLMRLDLFSGHYYKLRLFNDVPILEIDGLRMQLVRDFKTPLDYSKEVVKGLKLPSKGDAVVLDTCMGLGYTAIAAAGAKGVKTVVTCEVSEAVFTLAKWNPLSEALWEKDGKILPMQGSIADLIRNFDDGMFSFVIHDPPRFSHAPELYSEAFYKEMHRVCAKGARIFHYVGSVGKKKGKDIGKDTMKRLQAAGFRDLRYSARLQGIFAGKAIK